MPLLLFQSFFTEFHMPRCRALFWRILASTATSPHDSAYKRAYQINTPFRALLAYRHHGQQASTEVNENCFRGLIAVFPTLHISMLVKAASRAGDYWRIHDIAWQSLNDFYYILSASQAAAVSRLYSRLYRFLTEARTRTMAIAASLSLHFKIAGDLQRDD